MNSPQSRGSRVQRRRSRNAGVTTLEYSIMLVLVSLAVSTFGLGLGGSVNSVFSRMVSSLSEEEKRDEEPRPRNDDLDNHELS